ncbi:MULTISPECIES: flagellar assembly protein FliW [Cytobacillus]|uniref:flagellar assembly protein FliW n=1 Tax=Cytobacillus TaxID=2675230 RepID=UPI00203E34B8|nr:MULTISPECIES: flagellar assembly protein FliW [Cytobacillus]MCM3391454.1 flagellar assembly protein FliW [Cytobacillus oceanisediminis]UQX53829.1 flagellar assembly protein FliW [Cytobacillus pseudoceanisediminis]
MNIQTKFHGVQEINKEDIIHFPSGIPGFLEEKEFYILPLEGTDLFVLQSVKTPEVAFIVTDPFVLFPQYEFDLPKEALEKLEIQSDKDVATFAILTVMDPFEETTANLQAPLVINQTKKIGKQIILNQTPYKIKHKIITPQEQGER